jgi:hypothetical protein
VDIRHMQNKHPQILAHQHSCCGGGNFKAAPTGS